MIVKVAEYYFRFYIRIYFHFTISDPELSFVPLKGENETAAYTDAIQDDDNSTCVTNENQNLLIRLTYKTPSFNAISFDVVTQNTICDRLRLFYSAPEQLERCLSSSVLRYNCLLVAEGGSSCRYRCDCNLYDADSCRTFVLLAADQSHVCNILASDYSFI